MLLLVRAYIRIFAYILAYIFTYIHIFPLSVVWKGRGIGRECEKERECERERVDEERVGNRLLQLEWFLFLFFLA